MHMAALGYPRQDGQLVERFGGLPVEIGKAKALQSSQMSEVHQSADRERRGVTDGEAVQARHLSNLK